jgi:hypothetical protein
MPIIPMPSSTLGRHRRLSLAHRDADHSDTLVDTRPHCGFHSRIVMPIIPMPSSTRGRTAAFTRAS